MHDRRLEVGVSFDPTRGYFTSLSGRRVSLPQLATRVRGTDKIGTEKKNLASLDHKNIQHTVRYAELAPDRFKHFWR